MTTARKKQPDAPALHAEMRPLAWIKPHPENPRTHPPEQVALLAALIEKYGPDQAIVTDEEGWILKGHGRWMAAPGAGLEEFPVVIRRGLSEIEKTAMRIEDNQVGLLSGWNRDLIRSGLTTLKLAGYDMPMLGFDKYELAGFMAPPPKRSADEIPKAPKKPVTRLGDVWVLDSHRILVGDGTSREAWKTLFGRDLAAMIFTDPPYGISYEATSGKFDIIKGDQKRRDDLYKMLTTSLREMARYATDTAGVYIWHVTVTREDFSQAMKAAGLIEQQYLIWVKPGIILGHSDYRWQHEPCFYASKAGHKPAFYGERSESTVWHVELAAAKDIAVTIGNGIVVLDGEGGTLYLQSRVPKNKKLRQVRITKDTSVLLSGSDRQDGTVWEVTRDGNHEHPTQKPVELARRAIENSSRPGEIVADGFLGSGTTLIAAEMTARRCYGMDIDPVYADVTLDRWGKFTGKTPILQATGQTFAELQERRRRS